MSLIVLYFQHNTSVLSFYIDVVLTLSIYHVIISRLPSAFHIAFHVLFCIVLSYNFFIFPFIFRIMLSFTFHIASYIIPIFHILRCLMVSSIHDCSLYILHFLQNFDFLYILPCLYCYSVPCATLSRYLTKSKMLTVKTDELTLADNVIELHF